MSTNSGELPRKRAHPLPVQRWFTLNVATTLSSPNGNRSQQDTMRRLQWSEFEVLKILKIIHTKPPLIRDAKSNILTEEKNKIIQYLLFLFLIQYLLFLFQWESMLLVLQELKQKGENKLWKRNKFAAPPEILASAFTSDHLHSIYFLWSLRAGFLLSNVKKSELLSEIEWELLFHYKMCKLHHTPLSSNYQKPNVSEYFPIVF